MFTYCSNLTSIPQLNTSNGNSFTSMFNSCSNLTTIPQLDTSNGTKFGSMFSGCSALTSIPLLDVSKGTNISNTFYKMSMLQHISFVGTIPKSVDFKYSTLLTVDSLTSIINALKDLTGATKQTLTIGTENIAKLTDEQLRIIENKNWAYK